MSRPEQDPELVAAFSALRQEEEVQCPPFAEVLRRARTRSRRRVVHRLALVAATAVVGIAIVVLAAWLGLRTERPPESMPSITEWRSPTGFLLETPGREILAAPGLGYSVLDLASPNERRSLR